MKLSLYNLIFKSHTNPTKFMMGATSILWPLVEYINSGSISLFFLMVMLYGIGILWRTIDYMHRPIISTALTTIGAMLWSYEAWRNIFVSDHVSSHILLPAVFAFASLWLLLRCGTGETAHLIKKDCQL